MPQFYDTLLGEYIKNPWQRWIGLDALASKYFDYGMISYDELTNKGKIPFQDIDLEQAGIYSWEDVMMTHKIYEKQKKEGITENTVLRDIEIPLIEVIQDMELSWVRIDRDKLKWIWILLEQEISRLQKEIWREAGEEFNISSPKQVGEILFERLQLPSAKKTKTGFSVDSDVLSHLWKQYPIAQNIVDFRHYSKLLSTYINGLQERMDCKDRVHSNFNQTIAATGRLSSTDPNLQNIPTWDSIAGEIRAAFIPYNPEDFIVAYDYSQIEVRLLAVMSQDKNLLKAFHDEIDIHLNTARFIFGKEHISWTERKYAKAVNFWVIYGISPFWLSEMLGISRQDAKIYIDKFYENYPQVRTFFDWIITNCKEKWYVETLFWRRRYIPWVNDSNKMIASWAEREAINMPIQWTSADIIKIAMIRIYMYLQENNCASKLIMQVHDELVFNVVPKEKETLLPVIKSIMEWIIPNSPIEFRVDIGIGKNWKEAK